MKLLYALILALPFAVSASAQTSTTTTCERQNGKVVCRSSTQQPLDYNDALAKGRALVPDYNQTQQQQLSNRQLELQNELLERRLMLQAAPGYNAKECRRSARSALDKNDLSLARDILTACAR